jgi:hypothetical protein
MANSNIKLHESGETNKALAGGSREASGSEKEDEGAAA